MIFLSFILLSKFREFFRLDIWSKMFWISSGKSTILRIFKNLPSFFSADLFLMFIFIFMFIFMFILLLLLLLLLEFCWTELIIDTAKVNKDIKKESIRKSLKTKNFLKTWPNCPPWSQWSDRFSISWICKIKYGKIDKFWWILTENDQRMVQKRKTKVKNGFKIYQIWSMQ